MSAQIVISCDTRGCTSTHRTRWLRSIRRARRAAFHAGWRSNKTADRDWCPAHRPEDFG